MTPEERAIAVWENLPSDLDDNTSECLRIIVSEILGAINEEREACAQLVLARGNFKGVYTAIDPKLTAEAIRSRK